MKNINKLALAAVAALAFVPSAIATNVTVPDGMANSGGPGMGIGREDQETEDPAQFQQRWDLEAIVINGPTLTVVGGFPLTTWNGGFQPYKLGDIFIDSNADAVLPPASGAIVPVAGLLSNNDFRYDYVVSWTRNGANAINGFNVYSLSSTSVLNAVDDQGELQLRQSNPYTYNSGGTLVGSGTVSFVSGLSDSAVATNYGADVIVTGGTHNALTLNFTVGLNPLLLTTDLHLTLGCGNDNLLGEIRGGGQNANDGGATLVLLGLGLASIALIGRRTAKA